MRCLFCLETIIFVGNRITHSRPVNYSTSNFSIGYSSCFLSGAVLSEHQAENSLYGGVVVLYNYAYSLFTMQNDYPHIPVYKNCARFPGYRCSIRHRCIR